MTPESSHQRGKLRDRVEDVVAARGVTAVQLKAGGEMRGLDASLRGINCLRCADRPRDFHQPPHTTSFL